MTRIVVIIAAALAVVAFASSAQAYVQPGATIVSASLERQEQGDDTTQSAVVSGDGRFVALQTRSRNLYADDDADPPGKIRVGGIFRRDLQTGTLERVADGDIRGEDTPDVTDVRGAQNPSISVDGRYVVFSTAQSLVAADTNANVDVYERDMTLAPTDPGAYRLVSARDGSDVPAHYGPSTPDRPGLNPGAEITARSAVSADGNRVVFRTGTETSDLPAAATTSTPPQQVFVRDLASRITRLVTRTTSTGDPAGGALGGAAISADGSTVVWSGRNAPDQTPFRIGEGANPTLFFFLWQRPWDAGAPTRRITGQVDQDDAGCAPGAFVAEDPFALGPCFGPLATAEDQNGGVFAQVPAMSADGRRLAFLTTASPRATSANGSAADLWVTDMGDGVSRKAGSVELTRDSGAATSTAAPLDGVALSGDGRWLVLTTFRTTFTLPALRLSGAARTDIQGRDLYLVDLQDRSIERILRGYLGDTPSGSVGSVPSISSDGRRIVFTSDAPNLFYGDANDRIDAFAVTREDAPPAEPPDPDPDPPVTIEQKPRPVVAPKKLKVTVARGGNATAVLKVAAPASGSIRTVVRGRVPNASGTLKGSAHTLASKTTKVKRKATVTVTVTLSSRYRSRMRQVGKIAGQADVRFTTAKGVKYARVVTVVFAPRKTTKSKKKSSKKKSSKKHSGKRSVPTTPFSHISPSRERQENKS